MTPEPRTQLEPGHYAVPPGMVAAIVTHLRMEKKPRAAPPEPDAGRELVREHGIGVDAYLDVFQNVGAPWLWWSRLALGRHELEGILADPGIEVYTLRRNGAARGLLELDLRPGAEPEIAFFGLSSEEIGKGSGRWLMQHAMRLLWRRPITGITLHTCTLDSPKALGFYRSFGFEPVRQQVEIARDPRVAGILAPTDAPHVPIFA